MNDDELGRRLHDAIPEPGAGYWANIHGRLSEIEETNDFDSAENIAVENVDVETFPDTKPVVRRLTGMKNTNPPKFQGRPLLVAAALVLIVGLGALAVTWRNNDRGVTELEVAGQPADAAQPSSVPATGVSFDEAASPVGGAVKKLKLAGPEIGVMVVCDQGGFEPFLFSDQGTWIGCELPVGVTAGGESAMARAILGEVASPVGGLVAQLVIPGPQEAVIVECEGSFVPFLFMDQGTWIGCQSP